MKRLKRVLSLVLFLSLCMGLMGCSAKKAADDNKDKLNIVASMFPYYDITRAVIGRVEGINLNMAVSPGQDSHSFEPTPADIIQMEAADIFIYNGGEIETWVNEVLQSFDNSSQIQVEMLDAAKDIELKQEDGHVHEEEHGEGEYHENDHDGVDAHIWTSPKNAIAITQVICETLCQAMPEESEVFQKNAEDYIHQLEEIDGEIRDIVSNAKVKELIFADQFPLLYFTEEYGLKYHAAFQGCGHDMEPSARTICELIDEIKENGIKAVFYLELSSQRVADTICEDTGIEKLQFNSCHNISQKQFDEGVTYVELMRENVENMRKALN